MKRNIPDKIALLFFLVFLLISAYTIHAGLNGQFTEHKDWTYPFDNSEGLLKDKLVAVISVYFLLTLMAAFFALARNSGSRISEYILAIILTYWTFGLGIIIYYFRAKVTRYATLITWLSTVISVLSFLTFYYSWPAIYSIPFCLLFSFLKLIAKEKEKSFDFPLHFNLLFCTAIVLLVTRQFWI